MEKKVLFVQVQLYCSSTTVLFKYNCTVQFWIPYLHYLDRQVWANNADWDPMLQNLASDQVLHCLPLIQQFSVISRGSKMDKFYKELRCLNT